MKNTFGNAVSMTIFGESHGPAIGAVLDGLVPPRRWSAATRPRAAATMPKLQTCCAPATPTTRPMPSTRAIRTPGGADISPAVSPLPAWRRVRCAKAC